MHNFQESTTKQQKGVLERLLAVIFNFVFDGLLFIVYYIYLIENQPLH